MKRFVLVCLLIAGVTGLVNAQTANISRAWSFPVIKQDSALSGLASIRGCDVALNVEGDGQPLMAFTDYSTQGRVVVMALNGKDSLKVVWISPRYYSPQGGGSTPRCVRFADLDKDGKMEIVTQLNNVGILIFEHDGIAGSHNFGTQPSRVISTTDGLIALDGYSEYFEVNDVDGDTQQEILLAYRAGTAGTQCFFILSVDGDFSTNDPGFSSVNVEFKMERNSRYGVLTTASGGSLCCIFAANFDGNTTGKRGMMLQNYNFLNVVPMYASAANTYVMPDTSNADVLKKSHMWLGPTDDYALFGGTALDVDKDGREELYINGFYNKRIYQVSYASGQALNTIDSSNFVSFDIGTMVGKGSALQMFGVGYGDIEKNGKPNLYFGSSLGYEVVSMEYQGGDKKLPSSWTTKVLYAGDSTIYLSMVVTDSLGRMDTTKTRDSGEFVAKMGSKGYDLDKDGFEDLVLPYQAYSDSISITKRTWNTTTTKYDTTKYKIINPKRWSIRILSSTKNTGVEARDLVVITPDQYKLETNYPNPFNPSTTIGYYLPVREKISMKVYDALGRLVTTLINNADTPAGKGQVVWNGRNSAGQHVSSGVYFYALTWGNFSITQKMMLLK